MNWCRGRRAEVERQIYNRALRVRIDVEPGDGAIWPPKAEPDEFVV